MPGVLIHSLSVCFSQVPREVCLQNSSIPTIQKLLAVFSFLSVFHLLLQIEKVQHTTKYLLVKDDVDVLLFFCPRWSASLGSTSSVTFSSRTPPAPARSSSSTWGRSARGCGCPQGSTSSSPPPLSRTRRPILSSGFSLRNRPNLSEWLSHKAAFIKVILVFENAFMVLCEAPFHPRVPGIEIQCKMPENYMFSGVFSVPIILSTYFKHCKNVQFVIFWGFCWRNSKVVTFYIAALILPLLNVPVNYSGLHTQIWMMMRPPFTFNSKCSNVRQLDCPNWTSLEIWWHKMAVKWEQKPFMRTVLRVLRNNFYCTAIIHFP